MLFLSVELFVIFILTALSVPIIFSFPFCIVSAFYTKINVVIERLRALVLLDSQLSK